MDPYKTLGIIPNQDGTITRLPSPIPTLPTSPTGEGDPPVLSKDVPLNPTHNTSLRLYLPSHHDHPRLPIILRYHGGGFVLFSAATSFFHASCVRMAAEIPALVVSVEYRLAPEHPLPAAYDDAIDSLLWVHDQADPWVQRHGDLSRCFLEGISSGGNIVYHAGVRSLSLDLRSLVITGLIINQPFFGGEERTESEERLKNDRIVPPAVSDVLWKLCLPEGADRDHEFCNPARSTTAKVGGMLLPRCMVRGYVGDPLIDRQREFATWLEGRARGVVAKVEMEGFHAVDMLQREKADEFMEDVKSFVVCDSDAGGSHVAVATAKY